MGSGCLASHILFPERLQNTGIQNFNFKFMIRMLLSCNRQGGGNQVCFLKQKEGNWYFHLQIN